MKLNLKKSRSLLLAIFLILISFNFSHAQQHGTQQGPPPLPNEQQIEKMVTDLSNEHSLTEEQEKQISDLYFVHFKEVEEKREKQKDARDADREEMRKLRNSFENEVKTNLSEEQQVQFDAFTKEQKTEKSKQGKQKK